MNGEYVVRSRRHLTHRPSASPSRRSCAASGRLFATSGRLEQRTKERAHEEGAKRESSQAHNPPLLKRAGSTARCAPQLVARAAFPERDTTISPEAEDQRKVESDGRACECA